MIPLLVISHSKQALTRFLKDKASEEQSIITSLTPQATEYSINEIREINREVHIHQPLKRIYILEQFENSSIEAQNSFLKLLEEPPQNVEFILVASNPYNLLPTILSRTKIIRLDTVKREELDQKLSRAISSMDYSFFTASSKEDAMHFLIQMCLYYREHYKITQAPKIMREILRTYQLVQNNNLNPQLALDHLLIFIEKNYTIK